MTESLNMDIKAHIEKHLPQQVGAALQERLRKAEEDAAALATALRNLEQTKLEKQRLERDLLVSDAKLKEHVALEIREKAVDQRERDAEVAALKVQLESSKWFGHSMAEALRGLVRNVEWRNEFFRSDTQSIPVTNNGYTSLQSSNQTNNGTDKRTAE